MADAVTTQIIQDGPKKAVMRFTNISDGVGEGTAVTKVDVSALANLKPGGAAGGGQACDEVRIMKIQYSTFGIPVRLLWDASTDVIIKNLPADVSDTLDFTDIGGLKNTKASGWTGDINFIVLAALAAAGDSYDITLTLDKKYAGS